MIIKEILTEAQAYKKVTDPRQKKMLALAIYHDASFPRALLASVGKNPSDDAVVKLLSDIMDNKLSNTNYGDISKSGKYDSWLLRQYQNGIIDYEDLTGEGADALGAFSALSKRSLLKPEHQDINKIASVSRLVSLLRKPEYSDILRRIQNEEKIKQLKKDKKDTVLINDDRFYVSIPYNYGACYVFNNELGIQASFCTGSSTTNWFYKYAQTAPMIDILDKENMNAIEGKWQIHAPTRQIKNAAQNYNSRDEVFAELFPGLLKKICDEMLARQDEIKKMSAEIIEPDSGRNLVPDGYDVPRAVRQIKDTFPMSYDSKPPKEPEASEEDINHLFGGDQDNRRQPGLNGPDNIPPIDI